VRLYGIRIALGRGRGEAHLRPPAASGAGMVAKRVAEREAAPSQPAPAWVPAQTSDSRSRTQPLGRKRLARRPQPVG
jgi:hypothetical protein